MAFCTFLFLKAINQPRTKVVKRYTMQWGRNRGGQGGPWPPHFLTQTRLNSTMILSVHKEYTDQLDLVDIGNEFVRESHHRENVFGEFNLCAICQLLWVWLLGVA